jgi:glutamate synthase (NADPH) small chain
MGPKTIRTIPQERTAMPEQAAATRVGNFSEVALGYTLEHARMESERCLMCDDPKCVAGCPVGVNIPAFIQKICEGDHRGAYDVLTGENLLPAICGRVCPQENQCEGVCTVGTALEPVGVGRLERWIGDLAIERGWSNTPWIEPNGFRVGIVGSGPAGMACAADLAKAGCEVTMYEALHAPGGVLRYGIPEFRLPKAVLDAEMGNLVRLGVRMECNTLVGRLFTVEQMIKEMGFHAVFIGTGAGFPSFMGIPGESLNGVMSANELLTRSNLMRADRFPEFDTPLHLGRRVAVIGAGNTAMDAMRVSLRLGAEKVFCIYRRSRSECPARLEELHHAEQEGVEFHWLTAPAAILDDGRGNVRGLRNIRMQLGDPDDSGRRRPSPVPGSEHECEADMVVYAIGTHANPIIGQTSRLRLNSRSYIETNEALATSMAGVFAGGDIVTGAATVIQAMGAGRTAARSIKAYLSIQDGSRSGRATADGNRSVFGIAPGHRNHVRIRLAPRPCTVGTSA